MLLHRSDVERARNERRLSAQYECTRSLAEAPSPMEAVPRILQKVCETFGWEVGAMWTVDPQGMNLLCTELWCADKAKLQRFCQDTRRRPLARGVGLPGRVWATGKPAWIDDLRADNNFPRLSAATSGGLRSGIAVPVHVGAQCLGVLEFFSSTREEPDPKLTEVFAGLGSQIGESIERQRAEQQLREASANLARSNTDLQQFAYVASHDMFEPLRMITSYLQLLTGRHNLHLDEQGREFVSYALDGAKRMQALINDLLAYSRVDSRGGSFEPTNCEQVLESATSNLKLALQESGAAVTHEPLPTVRADPVQLTQLFQNLLGNAMKFHGPEPPRIHIECERQNGEWIFSVKDNGIGIEPRNYDRIFVIFQRLHTRKEYSGTGIGLAICKRIVERHGGRIWVESAPGQGSTFCFTLPAS